MHQAHQFMPRRDSSILAGLRPVIALVFALSGATAFGHDNADNPQAKDRVRFTVQVEQSVENDRLIAVLFAQSEATHAPEAADEVNRQIKWALAEARQVPEVDARSLAYRTFPVYRQQRIEGWRVRQTIELESADSAVLTTLLGELQARLGLESLRYALSREKRAATHEALVGKAIAAYQARAETIARHMGRSGYSMVEMNLNAGGLGGPRPVAPMVARSSLRSAEQVSAPAVEAGNQTLTASVSALIELAPR